MLRRAEGSASAAAAAAAAPDSTQRRVPALGRPQVMWWPEGQAGTTKRTFSGAGFLFSEREEMLAFLIQCYLPAIARISNLQRVCDQYGDLGKMLVTLVVYHSALIKVSIVWEEHVVTCWERSHSG